MSNKKRTQYQARPEMQPLPLHIILLFIPPFRAKGEERFDRERNPERATGIMR